MESHEPTIFFEDIEVDSELRSGWFDVEREEVIAFAARWDPYPHHLDDEAAAASVFGRIAACASHIFSISTRLTHDLPGTIAMAAGLGGDGFDLVAPVYAGSRVRLTRRYVAARESKSRPDVGIVTLEDSLVNEDGQLVFRTSGSMFVSKRTATRSHD
ncbi:MAG: MaoC/PaaZ C-terminal domain-containing protein [bacterium]|nr:MaoC/PaaZ C-terminal domain-containing protein [bacterium]